MLRSPEKIAAFCGLALAGAVVEQVVVEPMIASSKPTVDLKVEEKNRLFPPTTSDYISLSWQILNTPGINGVEGGFVKQMNLMGDQVSPPEIWGPAPRVGTAAKDGLLKRTFPSSDETTPPRITDKDMVINYGHPVSWIAEITVTHKDGTKEVFGLLTNPKVTPLPEDVIDSTSLTIVSVPGGRIQIDPFYVRLRTEYANGQVEWYVRMENPYIKRLPDGSVDFGEHGYGPSTADIEAANRKIIWQKH